MKVIFPTDEHHPYADEKALSVARQIGKDFDPDLRIAGSDGMDFYALSKFNKDPGRMKAGGLQREIDVWVASQRSWIDATPNARVMYIAGNHEDRLRSWLWRHPEVHGLEALALPNLLLFDQLGIEMADNDEVILNGLILKHGSVVAGNSAYSARGELEREHFKLHTITGHTHRGGTTYAIPLTYVQETIRPEENQLRTVSGRPVMSLRGSVMSLVWLNESLRLRGGLDTERSDDPYVVVVRASDSETDRPVAIAVDELVDQQEIVVKSLSGFLGRARGIAGASILGDGQVVLILDVPSMIKNNQARDTDPQSLTDTGEPGSDDSSAADLAPEAERMAS